MASAKNDLGIAFEFDTAGIAEEISLQFSVVRRELMIIKLIIVLFLLRCNIQVPIDNVENLS